MTAPQGEADYTIKQGTYGSALDVNLYDDGDNVVDLTDAESVMFSIRGEDDEDPLWTKPAAVYGDATTGAVRYVWEEGDTALDGEYYGEFTVNYPGGPTIYPADGYIHILIQPNLIDGIDRTEEVFATVADVRRIAHVVVTQDTLFTAQSIIEMLVGRPASDVDIIENQDRLVGNRDAYWLKMATAYQARWVTEQYDLFSRWNISAIQQSTRSATMQPLANMVAPLANQACSNISWMRSRKVRVRNRRGALLSRNYLPDDVFSGTEAAGWRDLK